MKDKCLANTTFNCRKQHCCKYCNNLKACKHSCQYAQQSCGQRKCYDDSGFPLDDETYEIMRKEMEVD